MIRHAAALLAAALPVAAQNSAGTITGTLDLEPVVWTVADEDAPLASTWRNTETARLVRLVGLARQEGGADLTDALVITFIAAGNPAEPDVVEPMVAFLPANSDRTWIAQGENVDLDVEAVQVTGGSMALAGSFTAQMTPGGTEGLVEEGQPLVTVDGNFQATLRREDDG